MVYKGKPVSNIFVLIEHILLQIYLLNEFDFICKNVALPEIVSDMIKLIKTCMVLTVSLEEIILHKKNKKSL